MSGEPKLNRQLGDQRKSGYVAGLHRASERNRSPLLLRIAAFGGAKSIFRGDRRQEGEKRKTGWRKWQSGANFSPAKFPAKREQYREICDGFGAPQAYPHTNRAT